jgi:hypothetical protein
MEQQFATASERLLKSVFDAEIRLTRGSCSQPQSSSWAAERHNQQKSPARGRAFDRLFPLRLAA